MQPHLYIIYAHDEWVRGINDTNGFQTSDDEIIYYMPNVKSETWVLK